MTLFLIVTTVAVVALVYFFATPDHRRKLWPRYQLVYIDRSASAWATRQVEAGEWATKHRLQGADVFEFSENVRPYDFDGDGERAGTNIFAVLDHAEADGRPCLIYTDITDEFTEFPFTNARFRSL